MDQLYFHGGAILTMRRERPRADALLVANGRVAALDGPQPDGATAVDLAGRALLPGFIDPHHHYCLAALDRRTPDLHLPPGSTMSDLLATVERFVREAPGDGWIRVQGFEPVKLREGRAPTRRELDEVCPHRPLLAIAYSVHDGVLNSAGLAAMGWSRPRDGRVSEARLFLAEARSRDALLERSEDAWLVEAEAHGRALLAAGIVRVGDAAVPPLFERLYERAAAEGRLPVTVHRMPVGGRSIIEPRVDAQATGEGPARAPVGPAKLLLDGADRCHVCVTKRQLASLAANAVRSAATGAGLAAVRTARQIGDWRPRLDGSLVGGVRTFETRELEQILRTAADHGLQVAQHAVGNAAIDQALTALERAGGGLDALPGRPRLEHVLIVDDALVQRIAQAGAMPVVQPYWLYDMGDAGMFELPRPLRWLPLRAMLDAGVELVGSSDYPVAGYDVLAGVRAAATRRTRAGGHVHAEEAIPVAEALRAYTANAARALGVEREAGTLGPGMRADLVVLSGDPLACDPERLDELAVRATYVDGRCAYQAAA
jgi:predicted amidohydrolase YtcJ